MQTNWGDLLKKLPSLLPQLGMRFRWKTKEMNGYPFIVTRTSLAGTHAWVIMAEQENASAFVILCCEDTSGHARDLKDWLDVNHDIRMEDPVDVYVPTQDGGGTFIVRTIYGRDNIRDYEEGRKTTVLERRFLTEGELRAWGQGTCDQDGWEHSYELSEEEFRRNRKRFKVVNEM